MSKSNTLTLISNPDWKTVLGNLTASAKIPGTASSSISPNQTVIRDLFVDLNDVKNQLASANVSPTATIIYADVVRIPSGCVWALKSNALVLVARRIEVEDSTQIFLDCRSTQTATFLVYAKEWAGSLQTLVVSSENPQDHPAVFTISSIESIGVQIGYQNGKPFQANLNKLQEPMLQQDSVLQVSLTSNFQCALFLSDSQPELAYPMLDWIRSCSAQSPNYIHLFLQSTSMLVMLTSDNSGVDYVPTLSRTVYTDMAQAFVQVAQDYETQYQRFVDKNQDIDARVQAAKLMLAHYTDKTGYDNELAQQCQNNLANAQKAVDEASANLRWQQVLVQKAQIAFKDGIANWEYDKKLEAAVTIIGGIVEFSAAAAALCFGEPEGAAAAAGAATTVAEASAETAKTLQQLAKLLECLAKTYAVAEKIAQASISLQKAQTLVDQISQVGLSADDGEQTNTSDYWATFKLEVDSRLQPAISQQVDGASEYKLALDKLDVYGQSLVANQLAYIRCSQELVRLQLQSQVTQNQVARLQQYITDLSTSKQPNDQMEQMLYQRYVDMKISLFIALKNYTNAYRYWALRNPLTSPSIVDSVNSLSGYMADIEQDYASALQSFDPPPQAFSDKQFAITDPGVLQSLQQDGTCKWSLTIDASIFGEFDRVRLTTVRVWLDGAHPQKGSDVYVMISNSGSYQDRKDGQSYQFSSAPLLRGFQYDSTGQILVDGQVADEQKYVYFQPTPFTDWTINIPKTSNQGLDLSGLTQIRMQLAGSLIAGK